MRSNLISLILVSVLATAANALPIKSQTESSVFDPGTESTRSSPGNEASAGTSPWKRDDDYDTAAPPWKRGSEKSLAPPWRRDGGYDVAAPPWKRDSEKSLAPPWKL